MPERWDELIWFVFNRANPCPTSFYWKSGSGLSEGENARRIDLNSTSSCFICQALYNIKWNFIRFFRRRVFWKAAWRDLITDREINFQALEHYLNGLLITRHRRRSGVFESRDFFTGNCRNIVDLEKGHINKRVHTSFAGRNAIEWWNPTLKISLSFAAFRFT